MRIHIMDKEYWWGGCVNRGHEMPYDIHSNGFFDLNGERENDQFASFMLSSKGRYIWSDVSFCAHIKDGIIELGGTDSATLESGGENLRDAYHTVMKKYFPFDGKFPDLMFWKKPQYNTWIELGTNQTTENILNYARGIKENGLPTGILMIDGGWQEEYGVYEFHKGKIPDPKYLIDSLHELGFPVMLWVSPIVTSAGCAVTL